MALAFTSSSAIHGSLSSSSSSSYQQPKVSQLGTFQPLDRPQMLSTALNSRRRLAMKPLNAEPKRNDSIVPQQQPLWLLS
ncbi:5'-adenylylsulfate reductase 1, chloroplastic-like [Lycium ferocissimum]|uniref:5'-adenylylsulfate reductase 1, chloroplastic-like n=1 Tax=Lycium ferocissimum TaxID=112874 RepID=UPI0028169366|nr:5'-adenylylsulfate reductase 1, chloroplastic-like [Lycium ferocissimum]